MPRTTVTVSTRLDDEGLKCLDSFVEALGRRNPDLFVSRSDALRYLVTNSGSAAVQRGELPVAASVPPGTILPGKSDAA